jgi:hypothetical protein
MAERPPSENLEQSSDFGNADDLSPSLEAVTPLSPDSREAEYEQA